ncbi:Uncharacterized protein APZ42_005257 [Daphnia magna]|uniref:Uncharacterized protein n=1 Tax=Daphnia magna TaxID=35525 RepID=A0A164GJX3_9CRUS|nr:Uncharacterized protein APZ42_005257 [Daphnia magna]
MPWRNRTDLTVLKTQSHFSSPTSPLEIGLEISSPISPVLFRFGRISPPIF